MSNSECDSDIDQTGAIKFRRTSLSSKVDSSSEVSDVESTTPRSNRRRGRRKKGQRIKRSTRGKKSQDSSEQSSGDLDEIFDNMHVDSNSSGNELPKTYTIDHMSFLEDSQNAHRNKGRIGSTELGDSLIMRGLGTSMQLDASLGQSLDDSVRFWEAETSAAKHDLQSFVKDFAAHGSESSGDDGGDSGSANVSTDLENATKGVPVVSSLFGVGGDDDSLEKSWMMATDPQAMSANDIMDISMMKSFDRSRRSPLQEDGIDASAIMKSFDGTNRKSPAQDESVNIGVSTQGVEAAAAADIILKNIGLEESL
eukprot:g741.t1